jgi:hypothetical protein
MVPTDQLNALERKQSQAFVRAAEDLVEAARRKDGDAAPLAYVSMTLTCMRCHLRLSQPLEPSRAI